MGTMQATGVEFVFFDIGGTLGRRDDAGNIVPFPSSKRLLENVREVIGLRVGIITTLGELTNAEAQALLDKAGLLKFIEQGGFVSEHDAGRAKPDPAIYTFAAKKVGVSVERCLFIGENLLEVIGARAAGMQSILKPCPPGRELPNQ